MADNESAQQFAARRRKEYVEALKVELDGYKRAGHEDRAAVVVEEIKRATKPSQASGAKPTDQR